MASLFTLFRRRHVEMKGEGGGGYGGGGVRTETSRSGRRLELLWGCGEGRVNWGKNSMLKENQQRMMEGQDNGGGGGDGGGGWGGSE